MTRRWANRRADDEVFQELRPELFGLAYRMLAISR